MQKSILVEVRCFGFKKKNCVNGTLVIAVDISIQQTVQCNTVVFIPGKTYY